MSANSGKLDATLITESGGKTMSTQSRELAERIHGVYKLANDWSEAKSKAAALIESALGEQWVKVTPETMPKDFERVVCFDGLANRDSEIETRYEVSSRRGKIWLCSHLEHVTHWRPLPTAPSEEGRR